MSINTLHKGDDDDDDNNNSWPHNLTRAHGKYGLLCIKQCKNKHINNNNNNNNNNITS